MSSVPRPRGRQSASVYRRRRLVLLLALAALVTVIVLVAVRPGSASGEKSPGAQHPDHRSSATGPASSTPSGSADANSACAPTSVTVVPILNATSFAAGAQPQLSLSITNSGTAACRFDVGTGAQEYTISSGAERIWDSRDCQTSPTSDVRTLDPGSTLTTQPFSWDRTRSSTATCGDAARQSVVAGGASYHLNVSVGKAKSQDSAQFILG